MVLHGYSLDRFYHPAIALLLLQELFKSTAKKISHFIVENTQCKWFECD